jgi:hypothetical protein
MIDRPAPSENAAPASQKSLTVPRSLIAGLALALAGLCGIPTSLGQDRAGLATARLTIPGVSKDGKSATSPSELHGFQRRGNTLVGEVRSREGAALRLVFDARTHALIGMRVLDPGPEPASLAACPDQTAQAPLPIAVSPAN